VETDKILNSARNYFVEVLGEENTNTYWGEPWKAAPKLPIFLRNLYDFYCIKIFNKPCLLMVSTSMEGDTPAAVRKHWQVVAKYFSGDIIYLVGVVSSFNRKRLIEQNVPFLVPGNQLYLPMLGIDLREYFKQTRRKVSDHIGAVSQALVLRQIQRKDCSGIPSRELAHRTGYSPMSITRALKELTEHGLASTERVGREKHLVFNASGIQLWQIATPFLQSPVRKSVWVGAADKQKLVTAAEAQIAGESALAHYTMLAEPSNEVVAVNVQEWPGIRKLLNIEELDGGRSALQNRYAGELDVIKIEQWSYNPGIILGRRTTERDPPIVDPLSLWLSFQWSQDERVEMACEQLIEQVWEQLDG
jgi:DNA-binding MarR family transcriptional regulator